MRREWETTEIDAHAEKAFLQCLLGMLDFKTEVQLGTKTESLTYYETGNGYQKGRGRVNLEKGTMLW